MTHTNPRLPDLFICGFTKCATSSLHDWLIQHPCLSGGSQKELEYLYDRESHFYNPKRNVYNQGLEGYAELFQDAPEGTLWLDSTPAYGYHETARKVIAAMPHRPPVIFVTRKPTDQIASTFHYFSNNKLYIDPSIDIVTFLEMVVDGRARTAFPEDHLKGALDWAAFEYWMALWRRDLGADRVIRLDMSEMLNDPDPVVRMIFKRIGLDPDTKIDFSGANETYFIKNRGLQQLNVMVRGLLPKGALYTKLRAFYRKLNTSTSKPNRSGREAELHAALESAVTRREIELLDTI